MATSEQRIEFINFESTYEILSTLRSRELTVGNEDKFILSMSWPWRAPDKEDFNSAYVFSAHEVVNINQSSGRKFGFRDSDKLRIRTIPEGTSTIRFSLIYVDISEDSPIAGILKAVGEAVIGRLTLGMSDIIKAGVEKAAKYNLEHIVESVSGGQESQKILGRTSLKFDGQDFKLIDLHTGEQPLKKENGLAIIPLKNTAGDLIANLWIKI